MKTNLLVPQRKGDMQNRKSLSLTYSKGIFYSVITILFIAPLIMLTLANLNFYQSQSESGTSRIAAGKLASYAKSVDADLPAALRIMAADALSKAVVHIDTNGTAFNDSAAVLRELLANGTIYGTGSSDFNVNLWAAIISQKGEAYGFDTNVEVGNITIRTIDSYTIGVTIEISVNATAAGHGIGLYRVYNSTADVPVDGFNDPLYTLKTNGIIKRPVKAPNITVSGTANFDAAVAAEFYMGSASGADFLERMEGKLAGTGKYGTAGLESVVYIPDMQANGLGVKAGQTNIDYLYFDTVVHSGSPVNGSSHSWLRVDAAHAGTYNITLG